MIGGQVLDMDGENQSLALPELQRVHRLKTGALLTAACRLGAVAAGRGGDAGKAWKRSRSSAGTWGWRSRSSTMCWT